MCILVFMGCFLIFFFKQKTAYEMRISDWSSDVCSSDLFVDDLRDLGDETGLLAARATDGTLVGAAIVEWSIGRRTRFATLADLSIEPAQRSSGLGARMVAEIEREARHRGMQWIFLESGKDNRRAHAFFERHAFREISRSEEHTSELQSLM